MVRPQAGPWRSARKRIEDIDAIGWPRLHALLFAARAEPALWRGRTAPRRRVTRPPPGSDRIAGVPRGRSHARATTSPTRPARPDLRVSRGSAARAPDKARSPATPRCGGAPRWRAPIAPLRLEARF